MNADRVRARVKSVIRAARRIQNPSDPLGREALDRLPSITGLARETIALGLLDHFETNPTESEIDKLLMCTAWAPACHINMSANVFTAPLRALILAVATSDRVFVRPSRRDPVITELLVRALQEDAEFEGKVEIVETVRPEAGHELHLYGSDENIAAIMTTLPEGVIVRPHGTGFGIAIVSAGIDDALAAEGLARDIGIFDQRGCLSPRFVLIEGDEFEAERFVGELHEALQRFSRQYPRGCLDSGLQAEIAQYRATMEAIGFYREGLAHAIGFDPAPRALVLPPAARIVHVAPTNAEKARALLEPWIRYVTAVGANVENGLAQQIKAWIPNARCSRLGQMQRPLLDGPVDGRTTAIRSSGFF